MSHLEQKKFKKIRTYPKQNYILKYCQTNVILVRKYHENLYVSLTNYVLCYRNSVTKCTGIHANDKGSPKSEFSNGLQLKNDILRKGLTPLGTEPLRRPAMPDRAVEKRRGGVR